MSFEDRTFVIIVTQYYKIRGYISLATGARLTDYIVQANQFVAVMDCEVWDFQNQLLYRTKFLDLNKDKIEIIMPADAVLPS